MKRLLILTVLLASSAHADNSDVYETIAGVSIGRVFLSPEERRLLDAARTRPPQTVAQSAPSSSEAAGSEPSPNASGYIVSSSGKSRFWRDGDFVEAASAPTPATRFPGDVKIIRHRADTARTESPGGAPADE